MRRAVPLLFLLVSCAGPTPLADGGAPTDAADVTDGRPTPPSSDAGTPSDAGLGEDAGPPPSSDCPPGEGRLAVTEVRGSIEDGAEIVVCGDLFGAQGPNILLFDDMEGREGGAAVAADDPVIGAWTDPGGLYADDAGRSGSGAMVVNDTTDTGGRGVSSTVGLVDPSGRFGLRHFDEVFLHLSIRDLGDFPGNVDRWQFYLMYIPSVAIIDFGGAATGSGAHEGHRDDCIQVYSCHFMTPVTETTTYDYWLHVRNFATGDDGVTEGISDQFRMAFAEDKAVLEAIQIEEERHCTKGRVGLDLDGSAGLFRRMVVERIRNEALASGT